VTDCWSVIYWVFLKL